MEEKKRNWLIATGVATVLCGCPGLACILIGALASLDESSLLDAPKYQYGIIAFLCFGLTLVIIPLAIGGYTWWSNRENKVELKPEDNEPLPPAI